MAQLALIIGNGFDIDMGLPSKYSDFMESKEWKDLFNGINKCFPEESYRHHSLIWRLQRASEDSNWFDIEEEIHTFVIKHTDNTEEEIRDIKNEFELLKKALKKYLVRVSKNFKSDEKKFAYKLLMATVRCPLSINEMYFNYTYAHSFLKIPLYYNPGSCTITFVHGNLQNDNIVLGCDLQEGELVNRQLSFMYKYNMLKKTNHIARNILEAREIIFFGHSINEMDFCYFKEFFKVASASPNPIRHLTMITYDEESERAIKDNMRNQGISVSDLYSNLWTFEFIHTQKLYEQDDEEIKKWNSFIMRILTPLSKGVKIKN